MLDKKIFIAVILIFLSAIIYLRYLQYKVIIDHPPLKNLFVLDVYIHILGFFLTFYLNMIIPEDKL